ncbi:MAG: Crp/Fnr family transcriptional regulator [Cyanobacteria bacterium P01_D01_bin.1]
MSFSFSEDETLMLREQPIEGSAVAPLQSELMHFRRGENLHRCGYEGAWKIHSGYVRSLTWNLEGDFVPLGFWGEGDIVGNAENQAHSYSYQAQCLTTVSAEYLGSNHAYSRAVLLANVRQSRDLLQIAYCRQTKLRLLCFISWLANTFGEPAPGGRRILAKLTHQEIAESIASTRVTVTRLLKMLACEGKIVWSSRERIVYDNVLLEAYEYGKDATI